MWYRVVVMAEELTEWQPGSKEWGYRRDHGKITFQGCPHIVSYFLQLDSVYTLRVCDIILSVFNLRCLRKIL